MIDINQLTEQDIGREVVYVREHCQTEYGKLSSWNGHFVFVRFKGPTGESCEPKDVSFTSVRAPGHKASKRFVFHSTQSRTTMEQQASLLEAEATEAAPEATSPDKATKLTMEDRIDIVDYIRAQQAPIIAETKVQAADIISKATQIEITPAQLDYLITSLPKHNLGAKFAIGNTSEVKLARQIADLELGHKTLYKLVESLAAQVQHIEQACEKL